VDDINDVAAMGGVNLLEESQRILGSTEFIGTVARSCQDVMTLDSEVLASKVAEICQSKGLDPTLISPEVLMLISHATEEMVKTQLSKLSHAAQHRMDAFKFNPLYEQCQDVRGQIRFLENVEKGEKRRHEEQEREILIRAAKSRAKVEDPERAKLREKAKELQRAEQEEIRQREANLTALQAIGPRKKAKLESAASTSLGSSASMASSSSSAGPSSMMSFRPRVKRVNMRDLVFIWENDKDRCRGFDLYKVLLNK
jgi:transcription initiation factor TFIID subunit 4